MIRGLRPYFSIIFAWAVLLAAPLAGAGVTLRNAKTGVQTTRQTNESGLYLFDLLEPCWYAVSIELTGFSKFTQENIEVQARGDITASR